MGKTVPVSRLKASLSAYLERVESGEEILVTDRGRPVARLVPFVGAQEDSLEEELRMERLYRSGVLKPGDGTSVTDLGSRILPVRSRESVLEALLEEREQGW
jgi:prevent-host-death family protein